MKRLIAALSIAACGAAFAQAPTPVGLWKTIDDETRKEKSLVRVTEAGGVLSGRIEKLLDPSRPNPTCDKCTDERKDQPIEGMAIVRNVRQSAADAGVWEGGEILDPNNGKTYKVRLRPIDAKTLEVRGYIGPFFRNQQWQRVE